MKDSKISWTDHTFNPWIGCQKVSPACDNCYAEALNKRMKWVGYPVLSPGMEIDYATIRPTWGPHTERRRTSSDNWYQPVRWNRKAKRKFRAWEKFKSTNPCLTDEQLEAHGFVKPRRPRVFCGSLCDVFDNAVPDEWRSHLFRLIYETPYLDWLLLTKRIGTVGKGNGKLPFLWGKGWPNVWIGITVCNRDEMLRDGPKLKVIPAARHFWSVEPMLSCLGEIPPEIIPDWVIAGGESGVKARPVHPDWVRSIRDQCQAAGVLFHFKQWGEFIPSELLSPSEILDSKCDFCFLTPTGKLSGAGKDWKEIKVPQDSLVAAMFRVGKKAAGRLLDGREWNESPSDVTE